MVITRPWRDENQDIDALQAQQFKTIYFPTVEIIQTVDDQFAIEQIVKFKPNYFVFTSPRAVARVAAMLTVVSELTQIPVISVGKRTSAACKAAGFVVQHEALTSTMIGLTELVKTLNVDRLCYPHSEQGRQELINYMRAAGKSLLNLTLYQPALPRLVNETYKAQIAAGQFDWIVFTSPSAYNNFKKILDLDDLTAFFLGRKIAVIGESTQSQIINDGVDVTLVAETPDILVLANELIYYETKRQLC